MIVVSDTSPIRALAHLSKVALLRDLYGTVIIPPAGEHELLNPTPPLTVVDPTRFPFVQIQSPRDQNRVRGFRASLDVGESEALALALELQADVLMDEAAGRRVALQLGLPVTGVLGILLKAKQRGLVGLIRPLIETIEVDSRFFISAKLKANVLRQAGE